MKRWLWITAGLLAVGGITIVGTSRGQFLNPRPMAQPQFPAQAAPKAGPMDMGPGEHGAQLRLPGQATPAPTPIPAPYAPANPPKAELPEFLREMPKPPVARAAMPSQMPTATPSKVALPPTERHKINRDIEITEQAGPYAIFLMAYTGERAPEMARKFVYELHVNPQYTKHKLRAYVFNFGLEEKQKEFERVQALKQQQIELYKRAIQEAGSATVVEPIRIRAVKIDEQTGVLLGGYRDRDEAERALVKIKKLPAPSPLKVDMDITELGTLPRDAEGRLIGNAAVQQLITDKDGVGRAYVNPFSRAFVTRNPALKLDAQGSLTAEDVAFLKRVNDGEPLSLFQCKHRYTLVVKQFNTQFKMVDAEEARKFLATLPKLYRKPGEWMDVAAHNAHNLAESLRKGGLPETYVLHSRNCSFVTVGGFDDPADQRVVQMQNYLEGRFRHEAYRSLQMLPRPIPMLVPG